MFTFKTHNRNHFSDDNVSRDTVDTANTMPMRNSNSSIDTAGNTAVAKIEPK